MSLLDSSPLPNHGGIGFFWLGGGSQFYDIAKVVMIDMKI